MNKLHLVTFLLVLNRLILSQETLGGPQRELYFE
jgi:hypothetical protein